MSAAPPYAWLLGATLALELALAVLLAPRGDRRRVAATALWLNLATHPLATCWVTFAGGPFALVELAVVLAESAGYRHLTGLSWARALLIGCAANGATIALGSALSP